MDTLPINKTQEKKRYQRRAYLRRKEKARVLHDIRLAEKAKKLQQEILDAGGVLYSSNPDEV